MGKGFNNYMCKKFFHPGSVDNLKRVWMAQQKTEAYQKKQDELKAQYEKEQELYNNRAMLTKGENKDKLSLNFMYDPPAGLKKEHEKEEGEVEYKFEWQRKYKAPRESYLSKDDDVQDQPFGIQVRNVRCIKCRKWGHINTDKECELYTAPWEVANATTSTDPLELMRGMREGGMVLKSGVVEGTAPIPTNQLVSSEDSDSDDGGQSEEVAFLKSLSQADKLKLLKKLEKMEKKKKKRHHKSDKKEKDRDKKKLKKAKSSDVSREKKVKKEHHKRKRHRSDSSERQRSKRRN